MDLVKDIKKIFGADKVDDKFEDMSPEELDKKVNGLIKEMQTGFMKPEERDAIKDRIDKGRALQHKRYKEDKKEKPKEAKSEKPKESFEDLSSRLREILMQSPSEQEELRKLKERAASDPDENAPPLGELGELPEGFEGPAEAVYHKEGEDYTDRSFAGTDYGSQDVYDLKENIENMERGLQGVKDPEYIKKMQRRIRRAKEALANRTKKPSSKDRYKKLKKSSLEKAKTNLKKGMK